MEQLALNDLQELAEKINEAHQEVNNSFKYTLQHAINAGGLLLAAKEKCGHGKWMKWHDHNINHSIDTSEIYMTITLNKEIIIANSERIRNLSIQGALRLIKGGTPMLQSMSNEWYTPRQYIEAVKEVMGNIDMDPASSHEANKTIGADVYFTEDDDGLNRDWYGRVFLNPPYGSLGKDFAQKLFESLGSSVQEAIMLVNSRATDADWFQPCFEGVICFTDHRIDFDSPHEKQTSSTHGSCFVYFGDNEYEFARVFGKHGNVVKRWP